MIRPRIGITTSLREGDGPGQSLDGRYVEAVEAAGGSPVIVPMTATREALLPVLQVLDGLLITGGPGIRQGLVGELPDDLPPTPRRRADTDTWAFEAAWARRLPVLGICYGMQFVNACLGGTIYGDAQAQLGTGPHAPSRNGGREVFHDLEVVQGTRLAEVAGEERRVNSWHLQAAERVGEGLTVSARSRDGVIEGIETGDGSLVGVQFHPERMPGTAWAGLFGDLVRRARE